MEKAKIFFDSWEKLGRLALLALLSYVALVILLRVSGKRTLSKMNVFDFVFVVALGSTLASTILNADTTLADGVATFIALMAMQVLLSWLCVTSHRVDHWVNGEPALLMHNGDFLNDTMKRERVTKEEVLSAIRNVNVKNFADVDSVILETDGTFSIVWQNVGDECSSLVDVKDHPDFVPDEGRMAKH